MAEKEERILVLKATEDDFIYKHFNGKGFVPRAEVVERMAKALRNNIVETQAQCSCLNMAEAALNALLSSGE